MRIPGTEPSSAILSQKKLFQKLESVVPKVSKKLKEYIRTEKNLKVLRPSGPNYWKNVEWIPYVFCKEYCSECQTN